MQIGIGKVDVIIPAKDRHNIRLGLAKVLAAAPWVNNIIVETSAPLATARIAGAKRCTTEWVAMFDDDVEIPGDWFEKVSAEITDGDGVVAVSSPDMSAIPDYYCMQLLTDRLIGLKGRDTPFIDNVLFKKSALEGYAPPLAFYCEDEFFYEHVKKKGRWLHTGPIGVVHYYREKDALYGGASQRIYKLEPAYIILRRTLVRFILPIFAALFYTHTPKTICRFWRINVRIIAGWLMGISLKEKIGKSWECWKT